MIGFLRHVERLRNRPEQRGFGVDRLLVHLTKRRARQGEFHRHPHGLHFWHHGDQQQPPSTNVLEGMLPPSRAVHAQLLLQELEGVEFERRGVKDARPFEQRLAVILAVLDLAEDFAWRTLYWGRT